jgi:two-component system, sensor histidine kinase YesM
MKKVTMKRFIYCFVFFLLLTLSLFYVLDILGAKTLKESLIQSSKNQLTYTEKMLNGVITEASMVGVQYTADNIVRYYQSQKKVLTYYDSQMQKVSISNRLKEQLLSSQAIDSIAIYWRSNGDFISTSPGSPAKDPFINVTKRGWRTYNGSLYYFSVYPYVHKSIESKDIQYVVGVKLKSQYLTSLVENSFNDSNTKAFYLVNKQLVMSNKIVNMEILEKVKENTKPNPQKISEFTYRTSDNDYYILSKYIKSIDTYLVAYTRTNEFFNPLEQIHQVFYSSILIILIIGLILILMFYRNFYKNVYLLDQKFYQVEQGDYSTRISNSPDNEFSKLFNSFNHMVTQIQALFASLKIETELRRNAEVKQLQAQINPHFLYNSLFFIMSMAKTSPDAVIKMSKHLANYYRYMTKRESKDVTVASELELANHYLSIMSLCKKVDYEINLPPELGTHRIMPLLIQPIVENAIQHGIEERQGAHRVSIDVKAHESGAIITIANDGKGLSPNEIEQLVTSVGNKQSPEGIKGVGLWNISHRLKNTYGEVNTMHFFTNEWGGLSVSLFIDFSLDEGEKNAITNS